jgi:hypothetical protein
LPGVKWLCAVGSFLFVRPLARRHCADFTPAWISAGGGGPWSRIAKLAAWISSWQALLMAVSWSPLRSRSETSSV